MEARKERTDRRISGTREWASHNVNCCSGCSNGCLYCYGRSAAMRFRGLRPEGWTDERITGNAIRKRYGRYEGTVMFPTTHDITLGNLNACLTVLGKLLDAGNRVLVVSKPHVDCIAAIVERFRLLADQILFRFTIGALTDRILSFWEPNAPSISERLACLQLAFEAGFQTSVSAEPLLEPERVEEIVETVDPYVTESIWIGKANRLRERTAWTRGRPGFEAEIRRIEELQEDDQVRAIYEKLKGHPKIRWKESYKEVLGLELPTRAGLDI